MIYIIIITQKHTTMKTQILNTKKIEATEFTMAATIVILNSIPSIEEQNELFVNDSIVLEF
jgi:hypothetical protein